MPKVIITGSSGYLAKCLVPEVAQHAEVVGVARNPGNPQQHYKTIPLDIQDAVAVLSVIRTEKPDAIIHCAACNPGGDDASMFAINAEGSKHVAQAAQQVGCRLVAVSSDTVLNGIDAPFPDSAVAAPLAGNRYAESKAQAENYIKKFTPDAAIVRTSLIYATDHMDRGTQSFMHRLEHDGELNLFTDVIRQPVFAGALSKSLLALALEHVDFSGTINIAGSEALSRYEFGIRMLDYWGVNYHGKLNAVRGRDIEGLPMDLRLELRYASMLNLPIPGVTEVLAK